MVDPDLTESVHHPLNNNIPISMVATTEPYGSFHNTLLSTGILVHGRHTILATLPQPGAISILLHGFPFERSTRSDFDIATIPDHVVRLGGVLIGIEGHGSGEVPVSELGNGSDDEDVVAVFGAYFDGE